MVGNKLDLKDQRCVRSEDTATTCSSKGIGYIETSAFESTNVD